MKTEKNNRNASNESGVRALVSYSNPLDQMRYIDAMNFVRDKVVLDIACGTGWGSYLLANAGAKKVYGVDLSPNALQIAQKWFLHKNIEYIQGHSLTIPINSETCDIIVCLETIEHLEDPRLFVDELYRVGKEKALLVISTPNAYCCKTSEAEKPKNPFHHVEYMRKEIETMLRSKWDVLEYKGQYPMQTNSKDIMVYRKWIRDYWIAQKMIMKLGFTGRLMSLIFSKLGILSCKDPAHSHPCNPVEVPNGYEPAVHYFVCRSQK